MESRLQPGVTLRLAAARGAMQRSGQASTPSATPTLFLLIHLRMSGKLSVVDASAPIEKHDRVVFDLDNGQQLRFNDVRKFGKMWVVIDPEEVTGCDRAGAAGRRLQFA